MANQGILQAQLKVKSSINLENGFIDNPLLKSVEGNGQINLTDENSFKGFASNTAIEHLDSVKNSSQNAIDLTNSLNNNPNLKYAKLDGNFNSNVAGKFDGNSSLQKVDLTQNIAVKPEDFKGNNSLKELPKLDFSNPDLTDIVTNATTLKPTTIDISNQDNTTCLGVHGDSTHQLGQLDGVKVSYNAPFNKATGPQIDVSYTDLNSNGLVNLFNTMPYNKGYSLVGEPSIENGIAKNFTTSDYVTLPEWQDTGKDFDMEFGFILPSDFGNYSRAFFSMGAGSTNATLFIVRDNKKGIYFRLNSSNSIALETESALSTDVLYYAKLKRVGTTYTFSLLDAQKTVLLSDTLESSSLLSNGALRAIRLGCDPIVYGNAFTGYLDLNHTYIKVQSQISTGPVGYEVVGSPTITNDIVSGFSDSNYIQTSENSNDIANKDFEMQAKVIVTANNSDGPVLTCNNGYVNGLFISSRKAGFRARYSDGTTKLEIYFTTNMVANSEYIINAKRENDLLTLKLYKDGTLIETLTHDLTDIDFIVQNIKYTIGCWNFGYLVFTNVDLNETYIKVNGKLWFGHESALIPWFNGNASMTKTIKVTGATGTSSLTSDEKAIATNKGWTLQEN